MKSKSVAFLAILTVFALIMFLIESFLPPLIVPGAKFGLGNIFILIAIVYFSYKEAVISVIAKCLLATFFGGFISLFYSLTAGLISFTISYFLINKASNRISIVAVATLSAVIHNVVQLLVFALFTKTLEVFLYLPYLVLAGVIAGITVGLATYYLIKFVPFHKFVGGNNVRRE